jgi:hypothetical protein
MGSSASSSSGNTNHRTSFSFLFGRQSSNSKPENDENLKPSSDKISVDELDDQLTPEEQRKLVETMEQIKHQEEEMARRLKSEQAHVCVSVDDDVCHK